MTMTPLTYTKTMPCWPLFVVTVTAVVPAETGATLNFPPAPPETVAIWGSSEVAVYDDAP